MSRTIRNEKVHRTYCNCKRCGKDRRYGSIHKDVAAKEAIKETREQRER
jgi:hypothetical protein